jgi:2-polyprenyl-3-methyl-5-hydroxy-6-metoxy-1,4-benzoquinol methylase
MERFINVVTGFLAPFIDVVKKYSGGNKGIEAGCAEGLASIYLTHLGYDITALDINEKLINKGRAANEYLRGKVNFLTGDLFHIDTLSERYDFAFSQGVLEHFEPEQIALLLDKQLKIARRVIFSVPSIRQSQRDFGDENLWSYKEWVQILKNFKIVYSFGFLAKKNKVQSLFLFPLYFAAPKLRAKILKRYFCTQIGFVLEHEG